MRLQPCGTSSPQQLYLHRVKTPMGGRPNLPLLPLLLASSTLIPTVGRGGGRRAQGPWWDFPFASTPPEGSVGAQTPANPPSLSLQKQLLPSGTPEGETELGQYKIWSTRVSLPYD